jgi:hypothetical protein
MYNIFNNALRMMNNQLRDLKGGRKTMIGLIHRIVDKY